LQDFIFGDYRYFEMFGGCSNYFVMNFWYYFQSHHFLEYRIIESNKLYIPVLA